MDRKTYEKTLDKEFQGRKVRTLTVIKNGLFRIPKGTICTVEHKYNGLHLLGDSCPTCGVRVYVSNVNYTDVDFVDQPSLETTVVDLVGGYIQYKCRCCQEIVSALRDSLCGRHLVCGTCARKKPLLGETETGDVES